MGGAVVVDNQYRGATHAVSSLLPFRVCVAAFPRLCEVLASAAPLARAVLTHPRGDGVPPPVSATGCCVSCFRSAGRGPHCAAGWFGWTGSRALSPGMRATRQVQQYWECLEKSLRFPAA